ncbi:nitroreductase family protein [Nitrogeniibacter mangrovi]|uniref:Nitroreductase family protein n=1 Tax=Nitrogeniibacter mangrovi TaxID=2016596 RepID=A0A6C1AZH6_9RHOO|nr:nitroreductase family protein [Nitrogeniibacter mangrovi]QID16771.1 nitroreductase family protein [Nitrogeniibacter mangrovi]
MLKQLKTTRRWLRSVVRARSHLSDMRRTIRYMRLRSEQPGTLEEFEYLLLFYYHKVEKGLSLPAPYRLFGVDVVRKILTIMRSWERAGHRTDHPVFVGATSSLSAYECRLATHGLDEEGRILPELRRYLAERANGSGLAADTPVRLSAAQIQEATCFDRLKALATVRRSCRDFAERRVEEEVVLRAIDIAQLSPSVCNRQSARVYVLTDPEQISAALSFQNGNRGFGHKVPALMVVTADARAFLDALERSQPYVDGGLFAMSLVYGLQSQGVVSCCLNWCVSDATDQAFKRLAGIPDWERIIMFIAVGYPLDEYLVPRSHRRNRDDVAMWGFRRTVSLEENL